MQVFTEGGRLFRTRYGDQLINELDPWDDMHAEGDDDV